MSRFWGGRLLSRWLLPRGSLAAAGMRAGGNPWLLPPGPVLKPPCEVVLKTGDAAVGLDRQQFLTTVAALELAAGHGLPAPRLIAADLDGSAAGSLAVLMTVLAGSSKVPRVASAVRLRALGAAAGALQGVALAPRPGLELRARALYDMDFAAWRTSVGTSQLLARAEDAFDGLPGPDGERAFVHGDPMAGQYRLERRFLQWHDRLGCRGRRITRHRPGHLAPRRSTVLRVIGTGVYWPPGRRRGAGRAGGRPAGRPAEHVAYWDVAAALCTVGDMAYVLPG